MSTISCTKNTTISAQAEARAKYDELAYNLTLEIFRPPEMIEELQTELGVYEAAKNAYDPVALAESRIDAIQDLMMRARLDARGSKLLNIELGAWMDMLCAD
jgi:hypothetical protein